MIQFLRTEWVLGLMVYELVAALSLLAGGAYLMLLFWRLAQLLRSERKKRRQSWPADPGAG